MIMSMACGQYTTCGDRTNRIMATPLDTVVSQALSAFMVWMWSMPSSASMARMQDAGTGAEVAEVKRDEQLEENSPAGGELVVFSMLGPLSHPARDASAHHENQGGDQEQPRHQLHEGRRRSYQQNLSAEKASENAGHRKRHEDAPRQAAKLVAIGPDAGGLSRPKRDGVGGVGVYRRDADEQQRRERKRSCHRRRPS